MPRPITDTSRRAAVPTHRRLARAGVALVVAGFVTAACDTSTFGSGGVLFMMALVEVSGNDQSLAPGGVASAPLVVMVVDQDGSPRRGMAIDWALSGPGALSATSSTSDAEGLVQVTYISGDEPGEVVVTASFNPVSSGSSASRPVDPVSFTITVEGP